MFGGYGARAGDSASSQPPGLGGYLAAVSQPDVAAMCERGPRRGQTLRPVTIRMLEDAARRSREETVGVPGVEYYVSGQPIGMITLVACVESVTQQPLFTEYQVTDGTGRLRAHKYMCGESAAPGEDVRAGEYVRIYGHLREWQGLLSVLVYRAARVESANEVPFHTIEVAHVHLAITGQLIRLPPGAGGHGVASAGSGALAALRASPQPAPTGLARPARAAPSLWWVPSVQNPADALSRPHDPTGGAAQQPQLQLEPQSPQAEQAQSTARGPRDSPEGGNEVEADAEGGDAPVGRGRGRGGGGSARGVPPSSG